MEKKTQDDPFFQNLEKQMASPEGLEGFRMPAQKRQLTKEKEIEIKQAFLKELGKWDNDYLSSVPDTRDLPLYLNPETEIINNNSFEVSLLFIDYLVAFLAEKIGKKSLEEKLEESEITFLDIVKTNNLELILRDGEGVIRVVFENKYPFKLLNYLVEFLK